MRKKIVLLPYDMDSAIGINNEGQLAFGYNLEDIDQTESGADVFNGQQSVLWKNVRAAFLPELRAMYQSLRSTGALSYDRVNNMFEDHTGKWPEAVYNEDAWFKYLAPLVEKGNAAYLSMLQGSKAEQRRWWLYNRFRYIDSKYNAGDSLTDVITVRGYAKADITVTPYADIYPTVKYGSYLVQVRGAHGVSSLLECPLDNVNDTEIMIFSASQLASVGDLSGLMVGFADFSKATRLQSLKLGDGEDYSNSNLTELYLGNNELLRSIDVRNSPALTQAVDLIGCGNLTTVLFEGTSVTGLPAFGLMNMKAIDATKLQEFVNGFAGASKSQITIIVGTLKAIFSSAYAEGYIERDPSVALIRPKASRKEERRPLTPEETRNILDVAETHPDGLILAVLYYLGLRRGEALGLKWGDFDFQVDQVHIVRDIDFAGSTAQEGELKTEAADRFVPIPPELKEMLLKQKGWPDEYVFHNEKGLPLSQATFKRKWCELMLAAGCADWREVPEGTSRPGDILKQIKPRLTPHYFRHNYVTLLYESGVDPLIAMKIVGHTDYQTTANIYTHVRDEMLKKATVNMNEVFQNRTEE